MVSSLAKYTALASALYGSPTSLAFTSSSLSRGRIVVPTRTTLFNDASSAPGGDESQQRPSLASSQQEEELNNGNADIEMPPVPSFGASAAKSDNPFTALDDIDAPLPAISDRKRAQEPARSSEFHDLEPRPASPARLSRLDSIARSQSVYVPSGSDEYWDLRDEISRLERNLEQATEAGVNDDPSANEARRSLRRARAKDPAHVYDVIGEAARSAERRGDDEATARYSEERDRARSMLPQFNLEGLWVGKYGSHGFEMINVTYSGDTLIAYKVTGDKNIPRGEISFTADLSPHDAADAYNNHQPKQQLEPIQLSEASAKKWGTKRLPRFPGRGHAAEPGFVNHLFMEGQLVVIGGGDYFSFAWVPLEHQIFFGRPSPELTLKMLREGGGSSLTAGTGMDVPGMDAGRKEQAEYAARCLEATTDGFWDERNEGKADPESCIWHGDDAEHCYFE